MIMDYDELPKITPWDRRAKILRDRAFMDGARQERVNDLAVLRGTVAHADRTAHKHVRRPVTVKTRSARWIRAHLREAHSETSSFVNAHERKCTRCTHKEW